MSNSYAGVLYLYNGGAQPEVWSVNTSEEIIRYVSYFQSARLERPGHAPIWIRSKKAVPKIPDLAEKDRVPYKSRHASTGPLFKSEIFYDPWKSLYKKRFD